MKKILSTLLLSSVLALTSTTVFASSEIAVYVDGTQVSYPTAPVIQNGSTLVPLRQTFQALGSSVDWDSSTQTITADKGDTNIVLTIGNNTAYKNDSSFNVSVAPQIINGSTFVPLRFVAESFGSDVSWDGSTQTVIINSGDDVVVTSPTVDSNTTTNVSSLGYTVSNGYLTYNGKQCKIIEVDGGDLSGDRESNVAVDIGFGDRVYWGLTNEYGQLVYVLADEITLQDEENEEVKSTGRYYHDEAKVPGTEHADLDEGHVIADSLGGVSNAYNITPQNSTLNRHGDQAYMEKVIRDAKGCTSFVATITYPNTTTQTPSRYRYEYILMGSKIVDEFDNVVPEESNTSTSTSTTIDTSTSNDEIMDISLIDTNGNGTVTIAEAKAAGFQMPITRDHWLYAYMIDRDGDGVVGE